MATAAARRGLATDNNHTTTTTTTTTTPPSAAPPTKAGVSSKNEEAEEEEQEGGQDASIQDEAAAKRALLLKRYGDRTQPSGPIPVKAASPDNAKAGVGKAAGFDVEKAVESEVNHNEIWGDCKSHRPIWFVGDDSASMTGVRLDYCTSPATFDTCIVHLVVYGTRLYGKQMINSFYVREARTACRHFRP